MTCMPLFKVKMKFTVTLIVIYVLKPKLQLWSLSRATTVDRV